jgi:hypothetical protein
MREKRERVVEELIALDRDAGVDRRFLCRDGASDFDAVLVRVNRMRLRYAEFQEYPS